MKMVANLVSERIAACFGVACPVHGECARYAAVNFSQAEVRTIGTCLSSGTYPLFIRIDLAKAA